MEVHQFPCLNDNYCFLLHDPTTGATAVVDTPEVAPIETALKEKGWKLTHVINTHHHWDHMAGNEELAATRCAVVGPKHEVKGAIPGVDISVTEGDVVTVGNMRAVVMETLATPPGTSCTTSQWSAKCSSVTPSSPWPRRLFEGDAATMWNSIQKIMALPKETDVYCAHEYTLTNARFAATVEPENAALIARLAEVEAARAAGIPTVPTTVEKELATNPFCRPKSEGLRRAIGMGKADDAAVFAETRRRKDAF